MCMHGFISSLIYTANVMWKWLTMAGGTHLTLTRVRALLSVEDQVTLESGRSIHYQNRSMPYRPHNVFMWSTCDQVIM